MRTKMCAMQRGGALLNAYGGKYKVKNKNPWLSMHFRPLGYAVHADANKQFFLVLNKMGWAKMIYYKSTYHWTSIRFELHFRCAHFFGHFTFIDSHLRKWMMILRLLIEKSDFSKKLRALFELCGLRNLSVCQKLWLLSSCSLYSCGFWTPL